MILSHSTTIGLEIHCQLTCLKSKLFCSCHCNYREYRPNENICPTCTGLPGTLPLLNQTAIEKAAMICMALRCTIPNNILFYRKNYFYLDLPKNFQLTQYNAHGITSIGVNGLLGYGQGQARIRRVQLEEDPGRLSYISGSSDTLIDYNRAGVPLVEIVTEPDFHDPRDVRLFLNKFASIVEHLGVCDTSLEGAVRCDANISISNSKRVEIKNVSSFGDVEKALKFEMTRQKAMLNYEMKIRGETRHWDEQRKITKPSRTKEEEQDYRYFHEPDIPSIQIDDDYIKELRSRMPELPDERKARFINYYKLTEHVSNVLIEHKDLADYFENSVKIYFAPKEISNFIVTDLMSYADDNSKRLGSTLRNIKMTPKQLAEIARMTNEGIINRKTAKEILYKAVVSGELITLSENETNFRKIDDKDQIMRSIENVFATESTAVLDAKKNPNASNYLLGKVMEFTKGRVDPALALSLINKKLLEY
ncbi:MAG TPA: Asp-tRNA(Asn)/Glu-tRNA(Gln) amidotransferase subunit GatB [Nitrososphaeraceae archaeon]|nr:Asp-tRNA(Asn)/Glu-tRNA(Gln) amidotransferase subunit GatB [Nitrososphaeraceae archaeon]